MNIDNKEKLNIDNKDKQKLTELIRIWNKNHSVYHYEKIRKILKKIIDQNTESFLTSHMVDIKEFDIGDRNPWKKKQNVINAKKQ